MIAMGRASGLDVCARRLDQDGTVITCIMISVWTLYIILRGLIRTPLMLTYNTTHEQMNTYNTTLEQQFLLQRIFRRKRST